MLLKAQELAQGDRLVSDRSSKPVVVEDVLVQEDGSVKVSLADGTTEWFMSNKIVLALRPVQ